MSEVIPQRLEELLRLMHRRWALALPKLGYPSVAAGFSPCAGRGWSSIEDWEEEVDGHAVQVLETAWMDLAQCERVLVEVEMGWMPDVWRVRLLVGESREDVLRRAVMHLVAACREEGVL